MLQNVWQEAEYHLDVCRATNGAHIKACVKVKGEFFIPAACFSIHCC